MLTKCPACDQQVSEAAASCPHCGHPMSSESTGSERQARVTTQATGRSVKAHQLVSGLLFIIGAVIAIVGAQANTDAAGIGGLIAFVGLVWFIGARFTAWWRYG